MSRIKLKDSIFEMLSTMSEGNPGAASALMEMLSPSSAEIDPDAFLGGVGKVLTLDTLGIYGTDIYVLYSDICDRDMVKMFAVLRAQQLGFIDGGVLRDACSRQDYSGRKMIDVDSLYQKVTEYLPNFKRV